MRTNSSASGKQAFALVASLPFWWFAGVGLDTLLKRRHPRWPVLLFGTILSAVFVLLAVLLTSMHGTVEDRAVTVPIQIGDISLEPALYHFPRRLDSSGFETPRAR